MSRHGLAALAALVAGCTGPSLDFFAAPEPGWEPRSMDRIAVVVLGESQEGRTRLAEGLARAGRRRGVTLVSLEALLADLPEEVIAARLDSAGGAARYGALAERAFREARVEAVLEISLDAGGRIVQPGIEHTVWDCEQWAEIRGRTVCVRPRELTFQGDTLYRPWASYDLRLRDPRTDEILWRGGAHTTGGGYRRPESLHRDLVEELLRELAGDGIIPPGEGGRSATGGADERG